jgi:sulfite exporter TauE/SafE
MVNRLLYNAGRIFTYGIFGGIIASFGLAFPLVKYQNLLSILLGIAMLVIGLTGFSAVRIPLLTSALGQVGKFLKKIFGPLLMKKGGASTLLLGSLNGMLPCGLSFLALTYCITLAGPIDGFNFMIWFGIGTLPVMLGFTSVFYWLVNRLKLGVASVSTVMIVASGILLIARVVVGSVHHARTIQEGVDIVLCR